MAHGFNRLANKQGDVTLTKIVTPEPAPDFALQAQDEHAVVAAVVDTETTGLDTEADEIIEVAARLSLWAADDDGLLVFKAWGPGFSQLRDPGFPLSAETTMITGLVDADVHGCEPDWEAFGRLLDRANIVIAHHAAFDRQFLDRHVPGARLWGCSQKDIAWTARGFASPKLELLLAWNGLWHDAHSALADANALTTLLAGPASLNGEQTYFDELYARAQEPELIVAAIGAPFDRKGALKNRRYEWDPGVKTWKRFVRVADAPAEAAWVKENIGIKPSVTEVDPMRRWVRA